MRKKLQILLVLAVILASWIFWSSNQEARTNVILYFQSMKPSYNYVLSPSTDLCYGKPLFVILVLSYVGHVELRSAHRQAISKEHLDSVNVRRVFLLAEIPKTEKTISQSAVEDEHKIFGDILQGNFLDQYRHLTQKHLMGLQWTTEFCREALFVLKMDDDIVYHFNRTYNYILKLNRSSIDRHSFLTGYMLNNSVPKREEQNKWFVTWDEYPRSVYPPYLSGWFYITTPNTAKRLCEEAILHDMFWIDDIFITGLLTEALNIKPKQLPSNFWLEYYELLECCMKDMVLKNLKCGYVVAPNGGRNNLIVEFNDISKQCINNCEERTDYKDWQQHCMVSNTRQLFGSGQAQVKSIKL